MDLSPRSIFARLDIYLLISLLAVTGYGLLIIAAASGLDQGLLLKQVMRIGFGFLVFLVVGMVPARYYYQAAPLLYALGLLALMLVLIISQAHKGATRWLDLWVFTLQPAELMKLAVPMLLARLCHDRLLPPSKSLTALTLGCLLFPVILIIRQPDLGTGLMIMASGLWVLYFAGIYWRWIGSAMVLVFSMLPVAWMRLHEYQKDRIYTFLHPEADPLGQGYHIIQSKIALGSGGFWGKGFLEGTQSQYHFLPERHTDFIFAVMGEEFGFIGALFLFMLYSLLLGRVVQICVAAPDTFTRLLSGALMGTFFLYLFVNVGMVIGLLPIVGVPLPLVSYGGSAFVTLMAAFGMLNSIHMNRLTWQHG